MTAQYQMLLVLMVMDLMLHNCGEIIGKDFLCNLSEIHLTNINPWDFATQKSAFKAGALTVAALLKHKFPVERLQASRELDPIVGVSLLGYLTSL